MAHAVRGACVCGSRPKAVRHGRGAGEPAEAVGACFYYLIPCMCVLVCIFVTQPSSHCLHRRSKDTWTNETSYFQGTNRDKSLIRSRSTTVLEPLHPLTECSSRTPRVLGTDCLSSSLSNPYSARSPSPMLDFHNWLKRYLYMQCCPKVGTIS